MSSWDVFVMVTRNMFKRKLRTFLTVLGVMVGTAAIVLMISLGLATEAHHRQTMEDAENDMTLIQVQMPWDNVVWGPDGQPEFPEDAPQLNDDMFDRFEGISGVSLASPIMQGNVFFRSDPYYMSAWVTGIRAAAMQYMGHTVEQGRVLMPGDNFAIVFGAYAERRFERMGATWDQRYNRDWEWQWQGREIPTFVDVMNDTIRMSFDQRFVQGALGEQMELTGGVRPIPAYNIEVVGLLESGNDWSANNAVFMDIELLLYLNNERIRMENEVRDDDSWWQIISPIRARPRETFERGIVRVTDVRYTSRVAREIDDMGFQVFYDGMMINILVEGQRQQQQLLAAIGAISLIIAAIGIANTMIMAVYERTREIGIMKVIGASLKDIRRMFLLESAMIGFFGGLFGVGLSLVGSYVMNNFDVPFLQPPPMPEWMGIAEVINPSLVTPWLCGVALLFAGVIGLVSGYFPARRATKLSALAAIRSE